MNEQDMNDAEAEAELWLREQLREFEQGWKTPQEEPPIVIEVQDEQ